MTSRLKVVKRIEYEVEGAKPVDIELRILDVRMIGFYLDVGVEALRSIFRYLYESLIVDLEE